MTRFFRIFCSLETFQSFLPRLLCGLLVSRETTLRSGNTATYPWWHWFINQIDFNSGSHSILFFFGDLKRRLEYCFWWWWLWFFLTGLLLGYGARGKDAAAEGVKSRRPDRDRAVTGTGPRSHSDAIATTENHSLL